MPHARSTSSARLPHAGTAARLQGLVAVMLLGVAGLVACQKADDKAAAKAPEAPVPSSCTWDEDCKSEKLICMYDKCVKGERTPEAKKAIEAQRKADEEKARQKAEEERPPGPNEGRLLVRVCPFVKKTGQLTARVYAKNKATGETKTLQIEDVLPSGALQSEFAYRKLPVGDYEVTVDYGVKVGDRRDVVTLKCDRREADARKQPCAKDGLTRLMTVVPVAAEPPPKIDENGKPEKKPCDWFAE